jgi:hypothetical protein
MNHSGLSHYIGSTALIVVVLCLLSASFGYSEMIHVDAKATSAYNGTSWNDTFDL